MDAARGTTTGSDDGSDTPASVQEFPGGSAPGLARDIHLESFVHHRWGVDQNLAIQLLKVIDAGVGREYEEKLRGGGMGYGDLKKKLFEVYWEQFAAARTKRAELAANLDYVNGVLKDGAARARALAQKVLHRARKAGGLE